MFVSKPLPAFAVLTFAALFLGACTQTSRFDSSSAAPASLTPTPVGVVEAGELNPTQPVEPSDGIPQDGVLVEGQTPVNQPGQQVAALAPPAGGGQDVTREALVGAWQANTGGTNCQIFLSLTKWSGGYRAASRGCAAAALSDVQAWDVKGKQVVLVNSNGSTAARLYRSATTRYDGATSSGSNISFSR